MEAGLGRLAPALIILAGFATSASAAGNVAETVRKWGLIGSWSRDCSVPPDHASGTVLTYAIEADGSVVLRRDFGDIRDENNVVAARISANGVLNLDVYFPSLDQTRQYGLIKLPDGTLRAIYNRSGRREYTIKDGKFTANGEPTPGEHRCR